ncbi:hypothetical protein JYT22_01310 [Endomicrobium sp. AH-315-J14]|nr:hypothetical protein [Endomicrobium sp. AH-315-J14]
MKDRAAARVVEDPFEGKPFPPAAFDAMHKRTARPEDGKWAPMADGERSGQTVMYRSQVHPHPIKKWIFVNFIAFDLKHVELHLLAGTDEPASEVVPDHRRPGLVPKLHHDGLLAVFNGGFKVKHGNYSMKLGDDVFLPPGEDACVVARMPERTLRIGRWSDLEATLPPSLWWRQTPPCLLHEGQLNERLSTEYATRKWGAGLGAVYDIRRSAVAFDQSGRSLIYAFGDWVTATDLARALKAAGVQSAAQLDINWKYTRFYLFHRPGEDGAPEIRETLIPKTKFHRKRYTYKPSYRDFFYVTLREP